MRFFSIYTPDPKTAGGPPSPEHMAEMGKLMAEGKSAGWLVDTGAWLPLTQGGAKVKRSADGITVVDGPFAETKEAIAGWALLQANSREEVIELTKRFLKVAGNGECVLRQIMEPGAGAPRM